MVAGMLPLRCETSSRWLDVALADFDKVLVDHAHCEKKAALSAMALVSSYPQHVELVRRMVKLAQEELRHFYQVHRRIVARGLELTRDFGDPYARALLAAARDGVEERLLDKLLVAGLIEARSCERLQLLADGLLDADLKHFYAGLANAEAAHFRLFVDLAERYGDPDAVAARLVELADIEAEIVAGLPVSPRIH